MAKKKKYSLPSLYRRLVLGITLSLVGSWLIAALRLNLVRDLLASSPFDTVCFIVEIFLFTLTLFGLLTLLAVLPEFKARLKRIDHLGEKDW